MPNWADPILLTALVALLLTLIGLFSMCSACFDEFYRRGGWQDIGAFILLLSAVPLCGIGCATLALALYRRGTYRLVPIIALTVVVPLACPPGNILVARSLSRSVSDIFLVREYEDARQREERRLNRAGIEEPKNEPSFVGKLSEDRHEAIVRHRKDLDWWFARPLRIARVENGLVVLDDGMVLSLYGIVRSNEMKVDLEWMESDLARSRQVAARLPAGRHAFDWNYLPLAPGEDPADEDAAAFARPLKDPQGWRYGAVPCLLYVDGHLLNSHFQGMGGSLQSFDGYESPPVLAH